jgi:hypothetical protein
LAEAYLALDLPETDRWRAIAEEGSITDAQLDALEQRLLHDGLDPATQAAAALKIARAGRAQSGWALAEARARLIAQQKTLEAAVLALAIDLLAIPAHPRVERAESGYRYREATSGRVLYVEDPVAAHWHAIGVWGPPIRPDPTRAAHVLRGAIDVATEFGRIAAGDTAVVTFAGARFRAPEPAIRLTAAGMSRDPRLVLEVRWSQIRSVGSATRRRRRSVAFEVKGEPVVILPIESSIGADDLIALLDRLIAHARR